MTTISDFKSQMTGSGSRANLFFVQLTFPSYVTLGALAGQQAQFLCKSASLPASTIQPVTINYRGRPVNFAGERTFTPWQISIYNDTTFNVRNALETWQAGIQGYDSSDGRVNPAEYQVDLSVNQLDRSGAIIKTYKFVDAFPTNIGQIQLDFDTQNAIETFDAEFTFNYFTSNTTGGSSLISATAGVNTPIGTFPVQIG